MLLDVSLPPGAKLPIGQGRAAPYLVFWQKNRVYIGIFQCINLFCYFLFVSEKKQRKKRIIGPDLNFSTDMGLSGLSAGSRTGLSGLILPHTHDWDERQHHQVVRLARSLAAPVPDLAQVQPPCSPPPLPPPPTPGVRPSVPPPCRPSQALLLCSSPHRASKGGWAAKRHQQQQQLGR